MIKVMCDINGVLLLITILFLGIVAGFFWGKLISKKKSAFDLIIKPESDYHKSISKAVLAELCSDRNWSGKSKDKIDTKNIIPIIKSMHMTSGVLPVVDGMLILKDGSEVDFNLILMNLSESVEIARWRKRDIDTIN